MSSVLLLSPIDADRVPSALFPQSTTLVNCQATNSVTFDEWTKAIAACQTSTVSVILGSYQTPVLAWAVAQRVFPNAMSLCDEGQDQPIWRDLITGDIWVEETEAVISAESECVEAVIVPTATPEIIVAALPTATTPTGAPVKATKTASSYLSNSQIGDAALLSNVFTFSSYDQQQYKRKIEALIEEAMNRHPRNPKLYQQAINKKRHGEASVKLKAEVEQKIKQQLTKGRSLDQKALNAWLTQQPDYAIPQIAADVKRKIEKTVAFYEAKQSQYATMTSKSDYQSILNPVHFDHGQHPNSIRHLKPSQQWTVLIDETGSNFDDSANNLDYNHKDLGRVVALMIPERTESKLPVLKSHHATTASDARNDQIMQTILNSDVGVFGFTVKDDGLSIRSHWSSAIVQLVRWTLLLLPMTEKPTKITFLIEQRDYKANYPLDLLAENIESELRAMNAQRFAQLSLSLAFIGKDDSPFNGYVDTIAHAWGSNAPTASDRFKKSQLENHCLLRPDTDAIERLYLAVNTQKHLTPVQWYDICATLSTEPRSSLLHNIMLDIGQQVQKNAQQWQNYMSVVSDKLRTKTYRLSELGAALDWLETYKPADQQLIPMARLYWLSTRLAQLNHQGSVDQALLSEVLNLASSLRNEAADDVCQVILRFATASTNFFEFEVAVGLIQKWLGEDVAIAGLLNHAKMHSTLGQIQSFTGKPHEAITHFDQAIELFKQLSDQSLAKKDIQQTNTYRLIAMMDADSTGWEAELWQQLDEFGVANEKIVKALATSGHEARYQQHLLLRAFITKPQAFEHEIADYLSQSPDWQMGEDHPWQWIAAYRGWLLLQAGKKDQAAARFNEAINICTDEAQGVTVHWIGSVINAWANQLHLQVDQRALSSAFLSVLQQQLQHAPYALLSQWQTIPKQGHDEQVSFIKQLAPFNFH